MNKRILFLFTIASLCFTSNQAQSNINPFISVLFGRQVYTNHEQTQWVGNVNGNTNYLYGNNTFSGELALGMNQTWNPWNIGIETFYDFIPASNRFTFQSNTPDDNYTIKQNLQHTFGVRIMPGYKVDSSTLLYIPVGWANSQFSLSSNAPQNVSSYQKRLNGLQLGLGIDEAITEQLHVKLEYINTTYPNFAIHYQDNTQSKNRQYSLSTNQFNIGLTYFLHNNTRDKQTSSAKLSDGFYTGIGMAKSLQTALLKTTDADSQQKQNLYGNGYMENVFIGFNHQFKQKFSLGMEAGAFWDNAKHKQSVDLNNAALLSRTTQIKHGYNLSALLGYSIAPNFKLYSRAGWAHGNYQYNVNLANQAYRKGKMLNGTLLGVGAELAFATNWAARGEYQETYYQTLHQSIGNARESITPTTHSYVIDLVYYLH